MSKEKGEKGKRQAETKIEGEGEDRTN